MSQEKIQVGSDGEFLASRYLRSQGYKILDRNFRAGKLGEIDLICLAPDGRTIVFVEVKARRSRRYGWPEEAITYAKLRHLHVAVQIYLGQRKIKNAPVRVDAVSVLDGTVRHIENIS